MAKIIANTATRRIAFGVVILAAILGLTACGSSGSSSSTTAATTEASAEKAPPGEPSTKEASSSEAGGSAATGLTPPGAQLKLGESATVAWVPPGSFEPAKAQTGIELAVTVKAIEEGSTGDLKNIELESNEKGAVPFYVRLEIEAPTGKATPAEESPALGFTAIDDRDQEQGSVIFLGNFPTCEEKEPPKPFDGGASYETCLTYLMNGGGSIQKVEWNSGPAKANEVTPYFEEPIVWSGG